MHVFVFPAARRIARRSEFLACYDEGRKFYTAHFILHVRKTAGISRFGLTVSRKVGNAVIRTRLKRILRECLRLFPDCPDGNSIVVVARKKAADIGLADAMAEIHPVLEFLRK